MSSVTLLCCFVFSSAGLLVAYAHMVMEQSNDSTSPSLHENNQPDVPPVVIVELPKTKKNHRKATEKISMKNRLVSRSRKPRPPPPANCVPVWGGCRLPGAACCDPCAFCHCRLFKTVCYCRVGNPQC
ncbi:agouti signaling protein 1 [Lepisosteus oculatus]|uniref:agouti signaling protein 1 n=1 Tax=Lepisosteus oculatus TaxID=7918 RepID=UPI00073FCB3D|nr:PREDICTED: agouti-signaling protein [Lepisosteus oculatus]